MIITAAHVTVFMLILARVIGIIQMAPFLNSRLIFALGKLALAFWISFILVFVIPIPVSLPSTPLMFGISIIIEFMIGISIGLVLQIFMTGIELAGALMDIQMGISVAAQLDPSSGTTASIFSKLVRWTALILFLLIDGHHIIFSSLHNSFTALPIGTPVPIIGVLPLLLDLGSKMFSLGLQISAPILLGIFFLDVTFSLLNRVAPQVNVFQLEFQLKPLVGTFIFLLILPGLIYTIISVLEKLSTLVLQIFSSFQGL